MHVFHIFFFPLSTLFNILAVIKIFLQTIAVLTHKFNFSDHTKTIAFHERLHLDTMPCDRRESTRKHNEQKIMWSKVEVQIQKEYKQNK